MKSVRGVVTIGLALCAFGCEERVPPENTPAFDELHGIVNDGKRVNEITLINDRDGSHPKLRFPPEVPVSVYTPDTHNPNPKTIKKGFAYQASVTLELDPQRKLVSIRRTPEHLVYDTVEIRFRSGLLNSAWAEATLSDLLRRSSKVVDKVEWGLKEYMPIAGDTLHSFDYIPLDDSFRSIDGRILWIHCSVGGTMTLGNQKPADCGSNFHYKNGLSVVYVFNASLMPHWQEIYREVIRFSDQVLEQ
ncbi:hypothetical protein [Ralstonia soli]|uniref:Lipoprotein transmembrane n=1 Tax=Ralstonia soli TaxID=2953896 RepID=A0ABT1AF08_9RALS|nr:hypothetical protein [Ralstonia soli]MCO5396953.1 hypothetical protein [Ralstonia soli]